MRHYRIQRGLTVIELLSVLAIFFVLSVIAYPNLQAVRNQLRLSEDARSVGLVLGELRAEAIRLRRPVRITFLTAGLQWDIGDDGIPDGAYVFHEGTAWNGVPAAIVINGFGLVRGLPGGSESLSVQHGPDSHAVMINSNGHLEVT